MLWVIDAIQMGTHNICLYKEVDKKYTDCNLKTVELLDCAFKSICCGYSFEMHQKVNAIQMVPTTFAFMKK